MRICLTVIAFAIKAGLCCPPATAQTPATARVAETLRSRVDTLAPNPAIFYRLVAWGTRDTRDERILNPAGLAPFHDELRAGWITERGPHWIAVDTLYRTADDGREKTLYAQPPFVTRVDSGALSFNERIDTSYFLSMVTKTVLPAAGSIGVHRGDSLIVSPARVMAMPFIGIEPIRIYLRVRR